MAANVISAEPRAEAIVEAISRALDPSFREEIRGLESPFGDGEVSSRILEAIAAAPPAEELRRKRFLDLPDGPWREGLRLGEGGSG
jgi:UDP-N-acetylglucosamine 2-epimerase